jgi:hypothetical protein
LDSKAPDSRVKETSRAPLSPSVLRARSPRHSSPNRRIRRWRARIWHSSRCRTRRLRGRSHCGGGDGPNTFGAVAALEAWMEQKRAPERIEASHLTKGVVNRTRPLCPYPARAEYTGSGSTDEAPSFVCRSSTWLRSRLKVGSNDVWRLDHRPLTRLRTRASSPRGRTAARTRGDSSRRPRARTGAPARCSP